MFGSGRRRRARLLETGRRVPAVVLSAAYGRFVHNENTGVGGSYERTSTSQKLRLRVEPPGGEPYEATLELGRDEPHAPPLPGVRLEVLVDPADAQALALVPVAAFTLPNGAVWQPTGGIAGELAELAARNDPSALMQRLAELQSASKPAPPPGP